MDPRIIDTGDESLLKKKSTDELRAMARAAGLRGYSDLRKKELIELLVKHKASSSETAAPQRSRGKSVKSGPTGGGATSARTKNARKTAQESPPRAVSAERFATQDVDGGEEKIESAKFEMAPRGTVWVLPGAYGSDLQEDIDHLPTLGEPVLCLLPQKPGVVHAYWLLHSGAQLKQLRLRLCRATDDAIELLDEIEIQAERGHWYFHVPESDEPGNFIAQLGSYDSTGAFVTAIRRGIARIPSLYASAQMDGHWWIGDDEFRAMYLRAGGVRRGGKLLWPGSSSSRTA